MKSSKFPIYNLYTFQIPFKKNTSIPTWKVTENEANEENRKKTPGQIITASNRRCVHNLSMHSVRPLGTHASLPKLSFCLSAISAFFLAPKCFCFLWLPHLCCELPTFCQFGFPRNLLWWWDLRPPKWSSLSSWRYWNLLEGAFMVGRKVQVLKIHCVLVHQTYYMWNC